MENASDDSCIDQAAGFDNYLKDYKLWHADHKGDIKKLATEAWLALSSEARMRYVKSLKEDLAGREIKNTEQYISKCNILLGTMPRFLLSLKLRRTKVGVRNRSYYIYKYRQFLKPHVKALTTTFAGITGGIKLPVLKMKFFALTAKNVKQPSLQLQPQTNPMVTMAALKANTVGDHQQQHNKMSKSPSTDKDDAPVNDGGSSDYFLLINLHSCLRKMNGMQNQRFREEIVSLIDNILGNANA